MSMWANICVQDLRIILPAPVRPSRKIGSKAEVVQHRKWHARSWPGRGFGHDTSKPLSSATTAPPAGQALPGWLLPGRLRRIYLNKSQVEVETLLPSMICTGYLPALQDHGRSGRRRLADRAEFPWRRLQGSVSPGASPLASSGCRKAMLPRVAALSAHNPSGYPPVLISSQCARPAANLPNDTLGSSAFHLEYVLRVDEESIGMC